MTDGWRDVDMGMFTAAFDASGHKSSHRVMAVAGFVSSVDDWIGFSKDWNERLSRDGLQYFHATEFANDVPKSKHKPLIGDLMAIIKTFTYRKFGAVVLTEGLTGRLKREDMERWHINAYSIAGRMCVNDVDKWKSKNGIQSPIKYVFEEGDIGAGRLHDGMLQDGHPAPDFEPGKKPRNTPNGTLIPAFVPLQAADFTAREYFMNVSRKMAKSERVERWPFLEFQKMAGEVYAIDYKGAEQFSKMIELVKYMDSVK